MDKHELLASVLGPVQAAPAPLLPDNRVRLLQGGDELFPAMCEAIGRAQRDVWLATYIFHTDEAGWLLCEALACAARRGVRVRVVVDGFGSLAALPRLRQWLEPAGVALEVFRPLEHWWQWLEPAQLRRLHLKLCAVDDTEAFVGGINIMDDRNDLRHGRSAQPRLDFAVGLRGPVVGQVVPVLRQVWDRSRRWRDLRERVERQLRDLEHRLGLGGAPALAQRAPGAGAHDTPESGDERLPGVLAALVVRDNFLRRRAIERSYVEAISRAQREVDLVTPYFYPGRLFRRSLMRAAARGVRVRLLLQGKLDYRFAGLAARVLYDELLAAGVEIHEYAAAFLHGKAARVDDSWASVGSSNIDPLSLLLNLEANVVVVDPGFNRQLGLAFEGALARSQRITSPPLGWGWRLLGRGLVGWVARTYLRLAGLRQRY